MVAIRSFMDTDAKGQLGGIECGEKARQKIAGESGKYTCPACGKSNEEIMEEREEIARELEKREGKMQEEEVPEELRLAYRDELGKGGRKDDEGVKEPKGKERAVDVTPPTTSTSTSTATPAPRTKSAPALAPRPTRTTQPALRQLAQQTPDPSMAWIDAGIYGLVAVLLFMVFRKLF
jgi:ubiquitin-conjugating enzyme E2 J1